MANIKDVAKEAGVGIATVSRVINNSGYVKESTRIKIEKIIEELNYVPNEIARSMTKQRNNIVAFILPNSMHLFFGELLYYIEKEMYKLGYKVLVCNSSEEIEKEITYLDMLKNNRVDAVILLTNNDIEPYLDKTLPIVSFDRRFSGIPFVASDNYAGGVLAAKKLLEQGCDKFMFIGDDAQGDLTPVITEVTKRRVGFTEYLEARGYEVVIVEYPLGNYLIEGKNIEKDIIKHSEVNGIFAISDAVAYATINVLKSIGREVPKDVKVIGFDGGRDFLNFGDKITSIAQSPKLIAKSISLSIQSFYNKTKTDNLIVPVVLSEGDTA